MTVLLTLYLNILISKRSLAEEVEERTRELNEEKLLLNTTLYSIGDGVISTDANGDILIMNNMAEKLTGQGLNEAVLRPIRRNI